MNRESSKVILRRQIGWSVLQYAMTIPLEAQRLYETVMGKPLKVGTRHDIKLIIDGVSFDAHFRNEGFNRNVFDHSDIVMLSYGIEAKRKLRSVFSESYGQMLKIREKLPSRARQPQLDNSNEYIVLSATSNPDVFILDCVTNNDAIKAQEELNGISEDFFESIIDETAGFHYSSTVRRIRKLDRSIGDTLKQLYDYRCQMSGEKIAEKYNACIVEAHHILPFTESMNNDTSNIIILSPNYHRIIHKTKPIWDSSSLSFKFPNGLVERVKLNKHL